MYTDGYENTVELIRHERNASEITLVAEGTISTLDTAGVYGYDPVNIPTSMFLRETPLTLPGKGISNVAEDMGKIVGELDRMHALKEMLHARLTFDTNATDAKTKAETALLNGHGVCQDYTHIFISVARATGVPARYVSGYLMMPGVEIQAASHAWAESLYFRPWVDWI